MVVMVMMMVMMMVATVEAAGPMSRTGRIDRDGRGFGGGGMFAHPRQPIGGSGGGDARLNPVLLTRFILTVRVRIVHIATVRIVDRFLLHHHGAAQQTTADAGLVPGCGHR
uniref:Putative secreted protein n=1 Tax=Anopheles marajoara TaxID=58244 RepID=A0A2M4C8X4_9DIPT